MYINWSPRIKVEKKIKKKDNNLQVSVGLLKEIFCHQYSGFDYIFLYK